MLPKQDLCHKWNGVDSSSATIYLVNRSPLQSPEKILKQSLEQILELRTNRNLFNLLNLFKLDAPETPLSHFGMPRTANESSTEETKESGAADITNLGSNLGSDLERPVAAQANQFAQSHQPNPINEQDISQQPIPLMSDLSNWRTAAPRATISNAAQTAIFSSQSRNFRHRVVAER